VFVKFFLFQEELSSFDAVSTPDVSHQPHHTTAILCAAFGDVVSNFEVIVGFASNRAASVIGLTPTDCGIPGSMEKVALGTLKHTGRLEDFVTHGD
jgi:hypothetical protein